MFDTGLIEIFRGDDTDGLGYQTINGVVDTDLDLTGCTLTFRYLDFVQTFTNVSSGDTLTITMSSAVTKTFPPGLGFASVRVTDSDGKLRTFNNRIPVIVKTSTPCVGGGEFHICFKKFPELEPLKIFAGGTSYMEYTGYIQRIIDKATAEQYGLAMLYDGIDSTDGASTGKAATPAAVYAVIQKLTDEYYNADDVDEKLADKLESVVVSELPSEGDGNTIYLVQTTTSGVYDSFMWIDGAWGRIGSSSGGTSDYAALSNKPQINGTTLQSGDNTLYGSSLAVSAEDATKVDAALAGKRNYTDLSYIVKGTPTDEGGYFTVNGIVYSILQVYGPTFEWTNGVDDSSIIKYQGQTHYTFFGDSSTAYGDFTLSADNNYLSTVEYGGTTYTITGYIPDTLALSSSIPTIGTSLTSTTTTAVTGGTIWSHLWGALTAIPDSAASLYAWITAKFAQYLPLVLSSDATIRNQSYVGGMTIGEDLMGVYLQDGEPSAGTFRAQAYLLDILATANGNSTAYAKPSQLGIAPWAASTSYAVGAIVAYNGATYRCTDEHTSGSAWDATKWTADAVAVNSQIPTATSDLANDSGYVTRYSQSATTVAAGTTALTFSDRTANRYDITALTSETVAVTLPTITSGKVADVVVTLVVGADVPTFDWDTTTNHFIPSVSDWATLTASKVNVLSFTSTGKANEWIVGRVTEE